MLCRDATAGSLWGIEGRQKISSKLLFIGVILKLPRVPSNHWAQGKVSGGWLFGTSLGGQIPERARGRGQKLLKTSRKKTHVRRRIFRRFVRSLLLDFRVFLDIFEFFAEDCFLYLRSVRKILPSGCLPLSHFQREIVTLSTLQGAMAEQRCLVLCCQNQPKSIGKLLASF